MDEEQKRIKEFINNLSGAVIGAVRSGNDEEKERLAEMLRQMNSQIPDEPEESADLKSFHLALVSLLEGNPVEPASLPEPFGTIFGTIMDKVRGVEGRSVSDGERQNREFLAKLAGVVIIMMRSGSEEEKSDLAAKLTEVHNAMPETEAGPRSFVLSLSGLLAGRPCEPSTIPGVYSKMYEKVLSESAKKPG